MVSGEKDALAKSFTALLPADASSANCHAGWNLNGAISASFRTRQVFHAKSREGQPDSLAKQPSIIWFVRWIGNKRSSARIVEQSH